RAAVWFGIHAGWDAGYDDELQRANEPNTDSPQISASAFASEQPTRSITAIDIDETVRWRAMADTGDIGTGSPGPALRRFTAETVQAHSQVQEEEKARRG